LKPPQLHAYAEKLQLDMARYTAEMDDEIYLQRIREHQQSGNASGVRGTPTFLLTEKFRMSRSACARWKQASERSCIITSRPFWALGAG